MNITTTTTTKICSSYIHNACKPVTTTTQKCCTECVHPIEYLFDLAFNEYDANNNYFIDSVFSILDKGIVFYDCDICCANCNNLYLLSSMDEARNLFEIIGLDSPGIVVPSINESNSSIKPKCCLNTKASIDKYLQFNEIVGYGQNSNYEPPFSICCNDFHSCYDELMCWINYEFSGISLNDLGIVEYGEIYNNCNGKFTSGLCVLLKTLKKYEEIIPNLFASRNEKLEFILFFLQQGFVFNCYSNYKRMVVGSVETYIKYLESVL